MPTISLPSYRERILFLGENGSGKSVLSRQLLDGMARYVVIDIKGDFTARPTDRIITDARDKVWKSSNPPDRIIYRPEPPYDEGRWISYIFACLFQRAKRRGKSTPFVVDVDEGLAIARTQITMWLSRLVVTGRSLDLGVWVASQRPAWIPKEIRSEAWRTYIFHLGNTDDEKEALRSCKGLTLEELQRATSNYSFLEVRRDPDSAGRRIITRYPPVLVTNQE